MNDFTHRKQTIKDLRTIVSLLLEDDLGRHNQRSWHILL